MVMAMSEASQLESEIIKRYSAEIPIRVGALAKALGIGVLRSTLQPGISGQIGPSNDYSSGFVIKVNRHEANTRQRFTIAHEIGHYVLHKEKIGLGITDTVLYRSKLSSSLEVEANRFAADLIMPMKSIREKIAGIGRGLDRSVAHELAQIFEVSTDAMEIRLRLR